MADLWTTEELPALLWDDDAEPPDDWPDDDIDPRLRDLRGQGLTAIQLHRMTDVPLQGELL